MPLSSDRNIPRRDALHFEGAPASGQTIYRGALVCLNASNEVVKGAVSTTLRTLGVAENSTLDAGYNGRIRARRGCYRFKNSASGDLITLSEVGSSCYVIDDETVAKTDGSSARSIAGKVIDVDAQGVWVQV